MSKYSSEGRDLLHGVLTDEVLARIKAERGRQDDKWGEQNHEPGKWKLIFDEEAGEAAKAFLEDDHEDYVGELIEAAAVLVAWIECEMRHDGDRAG